MAYIPKQHRPCLSCGSTGTKSRSRGLCWACYVDPLIRDRFPLLTFRGVGVSYPSGPVPPAPKGQECGKCGCWVQAGNYRNGHPREAAICTTCMNPDPKLRAMLHKRLARFEERAALGLPLFDGQENEHRIGA